MARFVFVVFLPEKLVLVLARRMSLGSEKRSREFFRVITALADSSHT
jgi:hypothetical protein